ncbi:PrsW family intramembrane metalloprotease [Microlunatus soli]|nr:PrsW family intramembrane metalloprotease [Microlunatus soli]
MARKKSFAVKPDEPVASFALISTIMPRGTGQHPQTYRIALAIGLAVALVAAIFGALPVAILVAAFAIPIVYIVYLYDVNLWEDEPVLVTVAAFLATGVLALAFTILWTSWRAPLADVVSYGGGLAQGPQVGTLLLVGVLVPIVAQLITQAGPIYLASRPKFDDLMDGLTFGVISGVAYATFDTLVRHREALFGGFVDSGNAAGWVALIFLEGFVKPLLMGTAAGIAAAEFSGLGKGYDGFTPRYFRGLAEAILANIAYQVGAYLLSYLPATQGLMLTLLWGLIILGVLILRVRNVLHLGLMEAALERVARNDESVGDDGELMFCASCEMPLVPGASFCNACGTAVRIGNRQQSRSDLPDRIALATGSTGRGAAPAGSEPAATRTGSATMSPAQPNGSAPGSAPSAGPTQTSPAQATSPSRTADPDRSVEPDRPARHASAGADDPQQSDVHPSSQVTPPRVNRNDSGDQNRGQA